MDNINFRDWDELIENLQSDKDDASREWEASAEALRQGRRPKRQWEDKLLINKAIWQELDMLLDLLREDQKERDRIISEQIEELTLADAIEKHGIVGIPMGLSKGEI